MNELPATADAFNRYKAIRDEIAREDNLISSRLSWFTASQSFLLTALAIAQSGKQEYPTASNNYLFPLVPIAALLSSLLILAGVVAGCLALIRWRGMLEALPQVTPAYPRIHRDAWIVGLGWSAPLGLPFIFVAAWIYLLAIGYR